MSSREKLSRVRRFVSEYLVDLNATQAAIRAGYSSRSATTIGPRLLEKDGVRKLLSKHFDRIIQGKIIQTEAVLHELACIAYFDPIHLFRDGKPLQPEEIQPDARRALQSIKVRQSKRKLANGEYEDVETTEYKFWNKNQALDTLAKYVGVLKSAADSVGEDEIQKLLVGLVGIVTRFCSPLQVQQIKGEIKALVDGTARTTSGM
jgi:phage terminase small subunit